MVFPDDMPSPCYVLEEAALRRNLAVLARVQEEAGAKIILALKGVAMVGALPIVAEALPGCAASSLNEVLLAEEFHKGEIHAYCPVYTEQDFLEIAMRSAHVTFNSLTQFAAFAPRLSGFSNRPSPGLRINPEYSPVKTPLYNPCVPGSRFGVRAVDLSSLRAERSNPVHAIEGFHCHNLCECGADDLGKTLEQIETLFGAWLPKLKWLNLGGGHLITREGYDIALLVRLLRDFRQRHPNLDIILEPGSAVGWKTGWLVSTVQDVFPSGDVTMVMVDMSFACHAPDCLEMPYKPAILGATDAVAGKPVYRIGGCSCLAGDFMGQGDYHFATPPKVGDKIVFDDMIHYTMVKTTLFNGVRHPSIGILRPDGAVELLSSFGYLDYRRRL